MRPCLLKKKVCFTIFFFIISQRIKPIRTETNFELSLQRKQGAFIIEVHNYVQIFLSSGTWTFFQLSCLNCYPRIFFSPLLGQLENKSLQNKTFNREKWEDISIHKLNKETWANWKSKYKQHTFSVKERWTYLFFSVITGLCFRVKVLGCCM